jgi:hypothetical protein
LAQQRVDARVGLDLKLHVAILERALHDALYDRMLTGLVRIPFRHDERPMAECFGDFREARTVHGK